MAVYGRTRYSISFFVNDNHEITFHSDIPPIHYSPGEYINPTDWKNKNGSFIMTRGPYRVMRVDHTIDWEESQSWAVPDRFWLYVYTVRAGRVFELFEGVKTLVRAFVGGTHKAPPSAAMLGGSGPST